MTNINLPYGKKSLNLTVPEERLQGILIPGIHQYKPTLSQEEIILQALRKPVGQLPLPKLVRDKNKVVIISSDHTRPVPSKITMPLLLEEIRKGNPEVDITILIATGFHRATTKAELIDKYGEKIVAEEKIVIHDSRDETSLVKIGTLPSGGELIINKLALEADLLMAEGFIEPHFFAGFSGGRKSILPGIASKTTVLANHCAEFIAHPQARTGVLNGNPIHQDMIYAAQKANLSFILNVVIDAEKRVINAFAGHPDEAHQQGSHFVKELTGVSRKEAEIVITTNGGYPLDQNIYQAVKSMTAAEATCQENGVIIVAAECNDGHGGEAFYNTFASASKIKDVMTEIMERPRQQTVPDQWESQILARVLLKHKVIMVTDAPREMVENMHLYWAHDLDKAIKMAEDFLSNDEAKITVIPDGVSVIVN